MRTIKSGKDVSIQSGHYPNLYVGLDASKPTPAVGYYGICKDTGKSYICYVNGIWSLVDSAAVHGASNHEGNTSNIFISILTGLGAGAENAALHRFDMATGAGAGTSAYECNLDIVPATDTFTCNMKIDAMALGVAGNRYYFLGIQGMNCEVVFYQTNAGDWSCHTHDGVTAQNTTITALNDKDLLTIRGNGTNIQYLVNGSVVATHTTIAFVGVSGTMQAYIVADASVTTSRDISIDYISTEVLK